MCRSRRRKDSQLQRRGPSTIGGEGGRLESACKEVTARLVSLRATSELANSQSSSRGRQAETTAEYAPGPKRIGEPEDIYAGRQRERDERHAHEAPECDDSANERETLALSPIPLETGCLIEKEGEAKGLEAVGERSEEEGQGDGGSCQEEQGRAVRPRSAPDEPICERWRVQ
jgi:hypothetical protein